MNFLQIKTNSGYYNFYSDGNSYYATFTNTKIIRTLTEDEIDNLLEYLFTNNITYSHEENGYQVYIDETNNKRYFRNGKEDLIKFIYNNGISTIVANSKIFSYGDVGKMITLKVQKEIVTMMLIATETAAMLTGSLAFNNHIQTYDQFIPLKTTDAIDLLNKSKNLTEEEKEYFKNAIFIEDMLRFARTTRSEVLRERLTNLGIVYFTDQELEDETLSGYYDFYYHNNVIHLRNEDHFILSAAHEYAHLFQCPTKYPYILEPTAEMISHEYFDRDGAYSYTEEIANLCLLMEVIGPQPVLEVCYAGINTNFENAIGEYLDEEDKEALLNEFKNYAKYADEEKIRSYIRKMVERKRELHPELEYLNKYLTGYERVNGRRGYYFNQHVPEFYKECKSDRQAYEVIRDVDINDIDELIYSIKEEVTLDRIKELYETGEIKNYSYISIEYLIDDHTFYDSAYTDEIDEDQDLDFHPKNFEDFCKGYVDDFENDITKFELVKKINLKDKNEIINELKEFGHDNHTIYRTVKKDGNYSRIYEEDGKLRELYYEMRFLPMPSISELFPEQCFVDDSEILKTNTEMEELFIEGTVLETKTYTDEDGNIRTYKTILHGDGTVTTEVSVKHKSK